MIRLRTQIRDSRISTMALLLALGAAPRTLPAQIAGGFPSAQCSGALGSLIPECRPGAAAVEAAPVRRAAGTAANAPVTVRDFHPDSSPPPPVEPPSQRATEFQRFADSFLGQMLPIYGGSLFEHVPTTFAPLDRVPVTADYVLGPGDEILLRSWGQINLDLQLTLDRAGAVYIPQLGSVTLAGLQFQQLPGFLRSQLGTVFRNFDMNVNMGQLRSIQVFVMGQARRPGTYTVSSLSTLVNALFASGGPAALGSMRHIQLRRGSQVVTQIDLYDLLQKGDKSKDCRLQPGDVIYVPPVGRQIAIAGSVNHPAIYELSGEKTVGEAIQIAGGLTAIADSQRATLERIENRSSLSTVELQLNESGLAVPVGDGDILHISSIVPRFHNAVTLRGNVANPGRFPWHAGMRLRDVIPERDALVTRDYWKKQNLLGFKSPSEEASSGPGAEARRKPSHTGIEASAPEINWSYAVIVRQNPRDLQTELIPFHLGKLVLEKDESQNLEVRAGDIVTIFSQSDFRVAMAQQNRMVRLEGEFAAAGIYNVRPGETLGQLIQRAGGLTPQAYLFGAEFLRESTRADQQRRLDQFTRDLEQSLEQGAANRFASANSEESASLANKVESQRRILERLRSVKPTGRIVLNLEPGSNDSSKLMELTLEDGDCFVVPARPSTVNVLGAVYNQNAFIHESRLRLGDYLRQAGGPNRDADAGRAFVIRADGSVIPNDGWSPFKKGFETMRINPGDSIVVPEALFRGSFLRGLRDWTQVFGQLALGAAAINVLR